MSKVLRTSCYDPNTKKVLCKSITVRKTDNEDEIRQNLEDWREEMKLKFKLQQANELINNNIVNNMDDISDEYEEEDEEEAEEDDPFKVHNLDLKIDHDTGSVIVFLGSSKSGKSHLWKHIYNKYYKDEDYCTILFAENLNTPIYDDLDKNIVKANSFIQEIPKIENAIQKGTNAKKYKFLNVLDDCVDNNTKNSLILKKLMVSLRNKKISSFLSFQYSTMIAKQNRTNAHYIFCLHMSTAEAIEDVVKKYLKSFLIGGKKKGERSRSMEQMIKLYQKLTSNYQFILIDTGTNDIKVCKI